MKGDDTKGFLFLAGLQSGTHSQVSLFDFSTVPSEKLFIRYPFSLINKFSSFAQLWTDRTFNMSLSSSKYKNCRQEYSRHPFLLSLDELHRLFGNTNAETGLIQLRAREAQEKYGPNKLEGEGVVQWYSVLLKQISNAMILVCSFVYLETSFLVFEMSYTPYAPCPMPII